METANKRLSLADILGRWEKAPGAIKLALLYGALLTAAESVASYFPGPDGRYPSADGIILGVVIHTVSVFLLLAHASLSHARGQKQLAGFLAALSAVPLIRIFSVSVPFFHFTIIQWLTIISGPLLIMAAALMRILGLGPADVGFRRPGLEDMPLQGGVAASGLLLGYAEYFILRPAQAWIPSLTVANLAWGALAVTLASGLAEELIFRGILLTESLRVVGPRAGVFAVTALFAAMHIGFLSFLDVAYVFFVGLFFAVIVLRTRCLYGVIFSHSLANVVLYLLAPFFFGQ